LARHPEWQDKLLAATVETEGTVRVGTRVKQARRVGGGTRSFTLEVTEHDPPNRLGFRGIDGPSGREGRSRSSRSTAGSAPVTRHSSTSRGKGSGFC
jgi:hypothetical protein